MCVVSTDAHHSGKPLGGVMPVIFIAGFVVGVGIYQVTKEGGKDAISTRTSGD